MTNNENDTAFTREVRFRKGYDYRDDPADTRGAHGMEIHFILRGDLGAVVARISTGWVAAPLAGHYRRGAGPQVRLSKPGVDAGVRELYPSGSSICSHSPEQRVEWWDGPEECDVLGGQCYSNVGYTVADRFLLTLVRDGEEAAWSWLEEIYEQWLIADVVEAVSS